MQQAGKKMALGLITCMQAREEKLLAPAPPGDELFEGEDPKEMQARSRSSFLYMEKGGGEGKKKA
jgi:hypothetical protein